MEGGGKGTHGVKVHTTRGMTQISPRVTVFPSSSHLHFMKYPPLPIKTSYYFKGQRTPRSCLSNTEGGAFVNMRRRKQTWRKRKKDKEARKIFGKGQEKKRKRKEKKKSQPGRCYTASANLRLSWPCIFSAACATPGGPQPIIAPSPFFLSPHPLRRKNETNGTTLNVLGNLVT